MVRYHRKRYPMRKNGFRKEGRYPVGSGTGRVLIKTGKTIYGTIAKAKNIVDTALEAASILDSYAEFNQAETKDKLIKFVLRAAIMQNPVILPSQILAELLCDPDFVYALKNGEIDILIRRFGSKTVYATTGFG